MDIYKTEEKVFSYIEEHAMLQAGDRVIAGVSGGADSVCLLLMLSEYGKRIPIELAVVHVNHGLREDAGEDAAYVEELCRERGLPFYLRCVDVRGTAAVQRCSEEDAGRRLRYQAFEDIAVELGAGKIAVAHNAGDRAETMLFHLFRGSGMKGLCGILPVRGNVIHPLLCLERREIEDYLTARGVSWRTDSTNEEDAYARNRIRHHILPYADEGLFAGAVGRMNRTADILTEEEEYLEGQTAAALKACVKREGDGLAELDIQRFLAFHPAIRKRMLFTLLEGLSPTGKDIGTVHVRDTLTLFTREGNRSFCLPMGISARRVYGSVILERRASGEPRGRTGMPEGQTALPEMEFQVIFPEKKEEVPKNQYTKWFDYDKIEEFPVVRFRQTGDFIALAGEKAQVIHKSLKDYMISARIPRELRDKIPVLAEGSHVLWLVGYRISEYYKVDRNTKRVLQVQLRKGCAGGETEEKDVGTH